MSKRNPLYIPEILLDIGIYLDRKTKFKCLHVCRLWHKTFVPLFWRDIKVIDGIAGKDSKGPGPRCLKNHAHLVYSLSIHQNHPGRYADVYPNLHTLQLTSKAIQDNNTTSESHPIRLISANISIVNLSLKRLNDFLTSAFWEAVSYLPDLNTLTVDGSTISDSNDIDAFWNACRNIENLRLLNSTIFTKEDLFPSIKFNNIRNMSIHYITVPSKTEQLSLLRQCPQLESIEWYNHFAVDVCSAFSESILKGQWPNLERLAFGGLIGDSDIGEVVESAHGINKLAFWECNIGEITLDIFKKHFYDTLVIVHFFECKTVDSSILQEIMCSCPNLEEILGDTILAIDIVRGERWVCTSLKTLNTTIKFNYLEDHMKPLVCKALSRLDKLEVLYLGGGSLPTQLSYGFILELKLGRGLESLVTLKNLRIIDFTNTEQWLEKDDILWMVNNWKRLKCVRGCLSYYPGKHNIMKEVLYDFGVETYRSYSK